MRAEQKYWILSSNDCIQRSRCRLDQNIAINMQIHYCSARMRGLFILTSYPFFYCCYTRLRGLDAYVFSLPAESLAGDSAENWILQFFNLIIVFNVSLCRRHPLRPLRKSLLFSVIIIFKRGRFQFILFPNPTATSSPYHNNASAIHHGRVTMRRSHPPIL